MPVEHKLRRAESPDDPHRCKAAGGQGQCPYLAVESTDYCSRHGANKQLAAQERESVRLYRLSKWQARLEEFADHPKVKGLREEIGVLRILLEETMARCNDQCDLLMMSNRISDLVVKIEKVVSACHRLEQSSGQLLDKSAALNFAAQIVEIIGRHVSDPEITDLITNEILESMVTLTPTMVEAKGA